MKTLIVSLAALAAVSTAALAEGGEDLSNSDTYFGKHSTNHKMVGSATDSNAFAIVKSSKKKPTAFERLNLLKSDGRRNEARQSDAPAVM